MAKAPIPGWCKTRLARTVGKERAAALQGALLLDTAAFLFSLEVETRIHLSLPSDRDGAMIDLPPDRVRVHHEPDLGTALDEVLATAFDDRDSILFVGTDSPAALMEHLPRALEASALGRPILGPTLDGGVYLIGVPAKWHDPFATAPWGTDTVFRRLFQNATHLDPILLPEAFDIDEEADVARALADASHATHGPRLLRTQEALRACL